MSAAVSEFVGSLSTARRELLLYDWESWARPEQLSPDGDWTTWLMLGGRGSGKTRAGAEWVRRIASENVSPIALVGQTMTEALAVMVRGESGLLNIYPEDDRPVIKGTTVTCVFRGDR